MRALIILFLSITFSSFGQMVKTKTGHSVCTCDTLRTDSIITIYTTFDRNGEVTSNWETYLNSDCELSDTTTVTYDREKRIKTYHHDDYTSIDTFDSLKYMIREITILPESIDTNYYHYIITKKSIIQLEDSVGESIVRTTELKRNGKKHRTMNRGGITIFVYDKNGNLRKSIHRSAEFSFRRDGFVSRYRLNSNGDCIRAIHRKNGKIEMKYKMYYAKGIETHMERCDKESGTKVITVFTYEYY